MLTRELRFSLLGPMQGWRGGTELDLGSPQQQATLAVLLLKAGVQTSKAQLIDAIWGSSPPRAADGTIRTYLSRLRRVLRGGEPVGPIRTVAGGYMIPTTAVDLDTTRFADLVHRVHSRRPEDPADNAVCLRDALALWRGTALAGLPGPFADAQRDRLSQLHVAAGEEVVAADVRMGRYASALADLTLLIAANPLRERLRELQMLALYRSGRQADALDAYDRVRRHLARELGIDPSRELQQLHQRILTRVPCR
ncbi:BTAD domain-containing putative transcriptional regulator [Streptomyces sp. NPDC049097]|uniref:AfsR/SARP family transcriptional regulator n=1 Tax=unclassified Streptomyces TaxID=2593676 RepID=UPI0034021BF1